MSGVFRQFVAAWLLIGIGALLFWGHPSVGTLLRRGTLDIPAALWMLFLVSACELRVRNHRLEYRRFARWKALPDDSVRGFRSSWHPGLGAISLNHFVFPFGRIYFDLTPENRKQMVELSGSRHDGEVSGGTPTPMRDELQRAQWCALAAAVGLIIGVSGSFHVAAHQPHQWTGDLSWVGPVSRVATAALTWPWGLLTCAAMCAWIVRSRYRGRNWILAFVVGLLVGSMALHIIVI